MIGDTDKATANWNSYAKQTIEGSDITKKIIPKIWASPNTAIGLAYGTAGYLYGSLTNQQVKVSIGNNAVQFEGNTINPFGLSGAITLGNSINYVGGANPDSGKTLSYQYGYYTYEYGSSNKGNLPTYNDRIILGPHESQHTYQAEILGPLFLPTYFLSGGISSKNWLEKDADKAGNKAYINWKKNENK